MNDRTTCECGHGSADHLRGVGACVNDGIDGEGCTCGVYHVDEDRPPPHEEWTIKIASINGRASFTARVSPDASPEIKRAMFEVAQFASVTLAPFRESSVDGSRTTD